MKRRTLLKTLTGFGMASVLPMSLVKPAYGQTADRFLITISATGGWDPTSLIDPKGDAPRSDGLGPVNNYSASEIKTVGNIVYAPYSNQIEAPSIEPLATSTIFSQNMPIDFWSLMAWIRRPMATIVADVLSGAANSEKVTQLFAH